MIRRSSGPLPTASLHSFSFRHFAARICNCISAWSGDTFRRVEVKITLGQFGSLRFSSLALDHQLYFPEYCCCSVYLDYSAKPLPLDFYRLL